MNYKDYIPDFIRQFLKDTTHPVQSFNALAMGLLGIVLAVHPDLVGHYFVPHDAGEISNLSVATTQAFGLQLIITAWLFGYSRMTTEAFQGFSFLSLGNICWNLYSMYQHGKHKHNENQVMIRAALVLNAIFVALALYCSFFESPRYRRKSEKILREQFLQKLRHGSAENINAPITRMGTR